MSVALSHEEQRGGRAGRRKTHLSLNLVTVVVEDEDEGCETSAKRNEE